MEDKSNKWLDEIIDILKSVAISIVVVFLLTQFVIKPIQIDGHSMQPTLLDKQRGFSNIIAHKLGDIKRFDIVILYDEIDRDYFVKRIIGLPGETIEVIGDQLFVNGILTEQDFLDNEYIRSMTNNHAVPFTRDFGPITVQAEHVFVMGDNRLNSTDSRARGAYPLSSIISKHVYILYPFNQIQFNHGEQ